MATETVNVVVDMSINTGKMLWVDSVYGNDSTGTPDRFDLPYLTPEVAIAAAQVGDSVRVRPGAYVITSNLWADGVVLDVVAGATLSMAVSLASMFNDGGVLGSMRVVGRGIIASPFQVQVAELTGGSTLSIECEEVGPKDYTSLLCVCTDGTINVNANRVFGVSAVQAGVVNIDCLTIDGGAQVAGGDDGKAYIRAASEVIRGYFYTVDPDGDHLISLECPTIAAEEITSSGGNIIISGRTLASTLIWVDAGNVTLNGLRITTPSGIAITDYLTNAKTLRFVNCEVTTSNDIGESPISIGGSNAATVQLIRTSLIPLSGADSIAATNARTVSAEASVCYGPVASSVTVEGDLLYDQGGPTTGQVPTANADGTWSWGAAAGGAAWGGITGTLSDQTDLQAALDGKVDGNAPITGATKTKITYDAKGLVTAGADATTADIADSSNKRYVTDAQQTVIGNTSGTNTGDQTNISGNAATVTTNANLTGPVTSVGNATAIADAALSIAKTSGLQTALDAKADKSIAIRTYTGTTDTLVLADAGNMVRGNNAGANTCTIPLNAVVAFPIGTQILFVQRGAGQMSIAITGGGTLNSYGGALKLVGQYAQALVTKVDTDEWSIDGNLTS